MVRFFLREAAAGAAVTGCCWLVIRVLWGAA